MQLILSKLAFLKNRDELRKVIANTGWLFFDRFLRMGIGLFVGVWVARYLGVKDFGTLNYAISLVSLFSAFATLGLPSLVVRALTQNPEKREQILGTTCLLQLIASLGSLALVIITTLVSKSGDKTTLILVALLSSAWIFKAFNAVDLWFQSQIKSKYTVLAKNTAFIITAIGKVLLINNEAPLWTFAGVTVLESVLGALGLIIFYQSQGSSLLRWRWSFALAKTLLKESWPLILSTFTVVIYMKVDQIMLGNMMGSQAVGLYASAARLSEVWYFIPTAVVSSIAPSIYKAKQESIAAYSKRLEQVMRLLVYSAILIALPMSFLSAPVITGLFGDGYIAAAPILSIHIWAAVFVFMGVGSSTWFIAEGLTQLSFLRTLIGAVINVSLNIILIPSYGGVGAAIATVIAQAFSSFLSNAIHPKARQIFLIQL
ncbi:flippase, partial [Leptolyngbya cf. ectocarpi LEGE 11479]